MPTGLETRWRSSSGKDGGGDASVDLTGESSEPGLVTAVGAAGELAPKHRGAFGRCESLSRARAGRFEQGHSAYLWIGAKV